MKLKTTIAITLLLAFTVLLANRADATTAEEKGFEIAARSDRTDVGFGESEVELKMILRNAAGQQSTRALRISTLEKPDESVGDKSLVLFDTPRDIEGTALLSHAKILDPDDQWPITSRRLMRGVGGRFQPEKNPLYNLCTGSFCQCSNCFRYVVVSSRMA